MTEYDDVVTRQLIEHITIESKDINTAQFKGGFEIRKDLDIENKTAIWLYEMILNESTKTGSAVEEIVEFAFKKKYREE